MYAMSAKVLQNYGRVLGEIEPGAYGLSESFLPHSKNAIREATRFMLKQIGSDRADLRQALVHGYVYVEQFVPDHEAEILIAAQLDDGTDTALREQSLLIINRIKAAMENAAQEMQRTLAAIP